MAGSNTTHIFESFTVKILVVAVLGGMLLVPLMLIWALVGERSERRDEVSREVGSVWGGRQSMGGVALSVPYDTVVTGPSGATPTTGRLTMLPASLQVDVELAPEVRQRSIFTVNLYRATAVVSGTFTAPDLARLGLQADAVQWHNAALLVGIADLRGIVGITAASWGDATLALEPAGDPAPFGSALSSRAPMPASGPVSFRIEMVVAGSGGLRITPTGATTDVTMRSTWASPGFAGAALPANHQIGPDGFRANWTSNFLSRPFPQSWIDAAVQSSTMRENLESSTFGVDLVTTVDHYQQTERAVKYGLLFVALTFALFLVWEVVEGLRLHPINYLLVGAALVVFYLLLLSLSEQVSFALAYGVAAAATVSLVSGYAVRVLGSFGRGGTMTAAMTTLYGLLFVLLRLEDLALLVGSIAVFVVLAALMYFTRGVDWYTGTARRTRT